MSYSVKPLNSKAIKNLIRDLESIIEDPSELIPKKGRSVRYSMGNESAIVVDNQNVLIIEKDGYLIPSIKIAKKLKLLVPTITVDAGAIRFVTNGADIMRPGITKIDKIP